LKQLFLALGAALALANSAVAFEGHVVCNGCSDQQAMQMALNTAPPGSSSIHVLDLDGLSISKYAVRKESEPGAYAQIARRVAVDSAAAAEFQHVVDAMLEMARAKDVGVPSDVAQSAFGIVRSPSRMARVQDHFNAPGLQQFRYHFSLVGHSMAAAIGATYKVEATAHFVDGTRYDFELTLARKPDGTPIVKATPIAGSGRDEEGNLIPETAAQYLGSRNLLRIQSALQDYINSALANGVRVCMGSDCFAPGGVVEFPEPPLPVRCEEGGGEMRCTRS
jgi:hypothetical protein